MTIHTPVFNASQHILNSVTTYFQPLFWGERIAGFEALARRKADGKMASIGLYMEDLNRGDGKQKELAFLTIENSCTFLEQAIPLSPELFITVNTHPQALTHPDFADMVASILNEHDIDQDRIKIEIIEEPFDLSKEDTIINNIRHLHSLGFALMMDDFGDNLERDQKRLKQIGTHIQGIKFGQSFMDLKTEEKDDLISSLPKDAFFIIEMIEDDTHLAYYNDLKTTRTPPVYAQGWHEKLGRDLTAKDALTLLKDRG